jgi:hypothetical protein
MHLVLPTAKQSDLFAEEWLTTSSMLATQVVGQVGGSTRKASASKVMQQAARDLGIRSVNTWSPSERVAFSRLAPFIVAADASNWPAAARLIARKTVRTKGGKAEAAYARLMGQNDRFLQSLREACRRADR